MTELEPQPNTEHEGTPRRGGMFRSLKVRNYRLYAAGQLVSLTRTWMQRVAPDWLRPPPTPTCAARGVIMALQLGRSLFLGLGGCVTSDRGCWRHIFVSTQCSLGL